MRFDEAMSTVPIADHALLSDCAGAALVTRQGSVDWLCLPRFDCPAVFAAMLDEDAGQFSVAPIGEGFTNTWSYRRGSLVLETVWESAAATLQVIDALALGRGEGGHELGESSPGVLLRRAFCLRGSVDVSVEFAPRPEYGLVHPRIDLRPGGVTTEGGPTIVRVDTESALTVADGRASGVITLTEGEDLTFALSVTGAWDAPPRRWKSRQIRRMLTDTEATWDSWSQLHQNYDGPHAELVRHSGRVLRGLSYQRTGAIVAAATTSLPEGVGSGRTWDYRFTWLRDASMTMQGLYVAACPDEAARFFAFLARVAGTQLARGQHLQIMYGIGGERDLSERELTHLSGWSDSGPVRVGNGAWQQHQLDVYGALLDAAWTLRDQLDPLAESTAEFLIAAVEAAAQHWTEDDQGIWEIRGDGRPFLHSKLMCWVALDRGVSLADRLGVEKGQVDRWRRGAEEIRQDILDRGWNDEAGAYTQSFGSTDLDASVLLMAITGFLGPDDERLRSTIDAIEAGLSDPRGLLYRYRGNDDHEAPEGTFLLCTFWLAHALALIGEVERSRVVLDRAASYATDLGLLAEQVDPDSGALWGNFPQAFSHLGLVIAAQALADADHKTAGASAAK